MNSTKGIANATYRVAAANKAKRRTAGNAVNKAKSGVQGRTKGVRRAGIITARPEGKSGSNLTVARLTSRRKAEKAPRVKTWAEVLGVDDHEPIIHPSELKGDHSDIYIGMSISFVLIVCGFIMAVSVQRLF